jgi:ketosteroid isomerase-like protein
VIRMMGGYRNWGTWEERITELELGDQVEAVMRKILEAAVVMDPRERATASETMRMIPESWANMGDGEARNC